MNVQSLSKEDEEQFTELKEIGFGSRFTGNVFSSISSDLVTELFNKRTNDTSGPFRYDLGNNIDLVNTWVNKIHIYP